MHFSDQQRSLRGVVYRIKQSLRHKFIRRQVRYRPSGHVNQSDTHIHAYTPICVQFHGNGIVQTELK